MQREWELPAFFVRAVHPVWKPMIVVELFLYLGIASLRSQQQQLSLLNKKRRRWDLNP